MGRGLDLREGWPSSELKLIVLYNMKTEKLGGSERERERDRENDTHRGDSSLMCMHDKRYIKYT